MFKNLNIIHLDRGYNEDRSNVVALIDAFYDRVRQDSLLESHLPTKHW
ncbi:MAG: hypothetical protein M2R45_05240 [Verrucomicrobia subdivision 3 bacterium]|nr:hypothetical protein [Limisphaerales bacterium]MCS1417798.1 hypothetical protein [Limisphaerales bacterium]